MLLTVQVLKRFAIHRWRSPPPYKNNKKVRDFKELHLPFTHQPALTTTCCYVQVLFILFLM
jgi:hypothetical protein